MATRFYLPTTGTPPVSPTPSAAWEVTTGFGTLPTDIVKTNTAIGIGTAQSKGGTTAFTDRLDRIYVSAQQLTAQTIAVGTFSMVQRVVESATTADDFLNVVILVVSADGATTRGTIYAGTSLVAVSATVGAENEEYPTTTAATRIKNALATSSVVAQAGDRIVLEIGARTGGTTSAQTFTHRYGDPSATADLALTSGTTLDQTPWLELSATLTWGARQIPVRPNPARYRATNW